MSVLDYMSEAAVAAVGAGAPGVVTGTLVGFTGDSRVPLITYPGQPGAGALPARTIADLSVGAIGGKVVLVFERGDGGSPIVLGLIRHVEASAREQSLVRVEADGLRLVVSAEEQLVLRCGRASITLTKAGKVLIDGAYVSNRSSGVVRIKGGSIQLN